MVNRPRVYSYDKYISLSDIVDCGYYRKYEPGEAPFLLNPPTNPRGRFGNTCIMVLATAWEKGDLDGITPEGNVYFVYTYNDDCHHDGLVHFNKKVQIVFKKSTGNAFSWTFRTELDDHYVDAITTGTSLSVLKQTYGWPKKQGGTIEELFTNKTSIEPYPATAKKSSSRPKRA